ncbi:MULTISPECIES: hypothetical protein [Cytobacillus]|uniref:hypothetical protein n=1 Tax=Cytobacillus TaxID=2675230 RepID=UPI00203B06EF|nr:hypothetical protein [Cytobacillus firmus]MCM3705840.1 hypothetical protein [Cytobacillus firmus]
MSDFEKKVQERLNKPKGVDPSMGNGAKRLPGYQDLGKLGRQAYERVKGKTVNDRVKNIMVKL